MIKNKKSTRRRWRKSDRESSTRLGLRNEEIPLCEIPNKSREDEDEYRLTLSL